MPILTKKELNNIYTLPFQRQSSLRNSLVQSMKKWGFLGSIIIVKTNIIDGIEKLYIIDGLHRKDAATYLNLPINADIICCNDWSKNDLVELISKLNSTGLLWKNEDYIRAHASLKNENYLRANHLLIKCNKINVSGLLSYLKGKREIQSGNMVLDEATYNKILAIEKFLLDMPKVSAKDIRCIYNIWDLEKFDTEVFKKYYISNIQKLRVLTDEERLRIYKSWFI